VIFAVDRTHHHKEGSEMKGVLKPLTISLVNHADGWWPMCKKAKKKGRNYTGVMPENAINSAVRQIHERVFLVATRMNDHESNHCLLLRHNDKSNSPNEEFSHRVSMLCITQCRIRLKISISNLQKV